MRTLTIADNWKDWKFGDTDAVMTFTALDDDKVPDFSDRTLTFKIASTLNNDLEHPKDFAATATGYIQGKDVILKTEDVKQLTPGNYVVELWVMDNDTHKDAIYPSKGFAQFTIEENSMKVSDITNISSMTLNAFWDALMQKVSTLTKGAKGDPGQTPKIVMGSVTKLSPDAQPSATLVPLQSDPNTYTLNLQLPQGVQGERGLQGIPGVGSKGLDGNNGLTPTIDPKTKHWMIGGTDTGVIAEGQAGKDADPSKYVTIVSFNQLRQQVQDNTTALDALQKAEAEAFKQEVAGILANAATSKIRNKKYDTLSARIDDDEEHQLYLYNSIAEMKADDGLAAGMVVQASNHNDGDHITQQFKIGSTPDGDELFVKLANGNYANEITRDRLFPPKIVAQPEMFLASNDVKRQKEIIDGCVYLGYEAFTADVHLEYDKTNGFHTQEDLSTLCDTFTYAKNLGYPTTALKIHYTGTFDDTTVPAYGSYITSTVIPALKSLNFDKVCVLNERQETVTPWTSKYIPQFIGLVNSIKTYGYKVGISYENDVHIAMGYSNQLGLMQSLDWIGCNLYPTIGAYGNLIGVDDVVAAFDEAMDSLYLIAQLGKPIIITETGIRPYPQYFASPSNYGFDDSTNGDYSVFTRYFEGVYRSKVKTVAKEVWDWHMWNDREIPDMARLIRQARGVI